MTSSLIEALKLDALTLRLANVTGGCAIVLTQKRTLPAPCTSTG